MRSRSENSAAAASITPGSAYTPVRGLIAWNLMSPTAMAIRYDGNRFAHLEAVRDQAVRIGLRHGAVRGGHHCHQPLRHANRRVVRGADLRRVLQRNPAARVNGLVLREQIRQLLPVRLRGRQPLKAGGLRLGAVVDPS